MVGVALLVGLALRQQLTPRVPRGLQNSLVFTVGLSSRPSWEAR